MSRLLFTIANETLRARVIEMLRKAPIGYRIEIKEPKRTTDQNSMLWLLLSGVATQKLHHGRKLKPETWKVLFMDALGDEIQWVPSLNGAQAVPVGHRSSDLSKAEMSDLIELIRAWSAENGVTFHDKAERAAA